MAIQQATINPEVKEAIVILKNLSADEKIRQEAFYREKRLHDEASALGGARREGIEKGRAEGRAEGQAEGKILKAVEVVNKLLQQNFPLENALFIAGIDEKTYEKYAK